MKNEVVDADIIEGPELEISEDEVRKAMKNDSKAGGPSKFVTDMLKAGGETVVHCVLGVS